MGFPRQGYWSGLPFPPPGDLPNSGIKPVSPGSPALQADSLPLHHLGSPNPHVYLENSFKTIGSDCSQSFDSRAKSSDFSLKDCFTAFLGKWSKLNQLALMERSKTKDGLQGSGFHTQHFDLDSMWQLNGYEHTHAPCGARPLETENCRESPSWRSWVLDSPGWASDRGLSLMLTAIYLPSTFCQWVKEAD